nr:hypothetical protein [Streptomyces sp. NRRL S-1022]
MAVDQQRAGGLRQFDQPAGARPDRGLVHVERRHRPPLGVEVLRRGDGVGRQQHRAGPGQPDEHRLVPLDVSGALHQLDAGEQFGVALDQPVLQVGLVPARPGDLQPAELARRRQPVVAALDDELGVGEEVVVAGVVRVQVGAHHQVDVPRPQPEDGEPGLHPLVGPDLDHGFGARRGAREPGVHQHVGAVSGLDEVTRHGRADRSGAEVEQVQSHP